MLSQLIKISPVVVCDKVGTEACAFGAQVADAHHNCDNYDEYKNCGLARILLSAFSAYRQTSDNFKSTGSQLK